MSYDLMVFDPSKAPEERDEFLEWYKKQTEWSEGHSYDDPAICGVPLREWFLDMTKIFPAMNGPFALEDDPDDESLVTDYCVAKTCIYVGFAWSKAQQAYETTLRFAEKHQLGFYDVSSEAGEVWLPSSSGKLVVAHAESQPAPGPRLVTIAIAKKDLTEDGN